VDAYNGALSSFKDRLDTQLQTLGGLEAALGAGGTSFRDSLLATAEKYVALDWSDRLPLRTAMKVALKKVFLRFAVEATRAEQNAKALTGWFAINIPAPIVYETTAVEA
jgi:hypothetical protein